MNDDTLCDSYARSMMYTYIFFFRDENLVRDAVRDVYVHAEECVPLISIASIQAQFVTRIHSS